MGIRRVATPIVSEAEVWLGVLRGDARIQAALMLRDLV